MQGKYCLKKASDFRKTYKKGERTIAPHFVLFARKNALTISRLGVSISSSHLKLATQRNRLRRVAKETFRTEVKDNVGGYDLILSSRSGAGGEGLGKITKEARNLLLGFCKKYV